MAQPRAEAHSFVKRLISAIVMIPPVLGAIYAGYPYFDVLVVLGGGLLIYEWIRLCRHAAAPAQRALFFAAGLVYIGFALVSLIVVRHDTDFGRHAVLFLFLIAWATDTGAYAFGRLIGGPKLAPVLSPNKTWAGFIGGVACAAGVGVGFAAFLGNSALFGLVVGAVVLGMISQGGDLMESRIKRHFQVKDTSALIPGHGGFLDRLDSLLAMSWAVGLVYWVAREEILKWM